MKRLVVILLLCLAGRADADERRAWVKAVPDDATWKHYSKVIGSDEVGKFIIDIKTNDIYFIDVNLFNIHADFVLGVLLKQAWTADNVREYNKNYERVKPKFILGYLTHHLKIDKWTMAFWEGDKIGPDDVIRARRRLDQAFFKKELPFRPDSPMQQKIAGDVVKKGIKTITNDEVGVGPPIPLLDLATKVDIIVKATVKSDKPVTDPSFAAVTAYPVYEAELAVISTIQGKVGKTIKFRHYTYKPANVGIGYSPLAYDLEVGRTYVVFAIKGRNGTYRQFQKDHTQKENQGLIPAGDDKPHRGATIVDIAWEELRLLAQSTVAEHAVEAIEELDQLSGGGRSDLKDFDRGLVLGELRPLVLSKNDDIAKAAISVFGADGPYFVERDAPYWLAGIGRGNVSGVGPLVPSKLPGAVLATKELIEVANTRPTLKALAIRALGRTRSIPVAQIVAWGKDKDVDVRRAAIVISVESSDRSLIAKAVTDPLPEIRTAAALAIGFSQDPKQLPLIGKLLQDREGKVRAQAAMSLLSFAIDQAAPTMKANLNTDYAPLFVNELAKKDPKPYLSRLAEVVEKNQQPASWWGGSIPAGDSWKLLFDHLKKLPAAELGNAANTRLFDSMEKMKWFGSSEPTKLYALYLHAGLTARARAFRDVMKKAVTYNIEQYFDMADKHPDNYLH